MQRPRTHKYPPAIVNSVLVLVLSMSPTLSSCRQGGELDWTSLKQEIRKKYPSVPQISTEELADWLESDEKPAPVLLDVREPAEYEVSHLKGSLLASTEGDALKILRSYPKEHPIVLYCSVGYRSSRMAGRLRSKGYTNVYNLEGSIFQWANEGRPLYAGGKPVSRVHPYNAYWGKLLDRRLWAEPPDAE